LCRHRKLVPFGKQRHRNLPNYIGQLSASPLPGKKGRAFATSARILGPVAWFVNEPADSAYPLPGIVRGGKESALACNFGQRTTRRQDRRTTEKHALQRRQAKAL